MHDEKTTISPTLVPESDRLQVLPLLIGAQHMMRFEGLVYAWMDRLAEEYGGGFWNFYSLSNEGFYMAPLTPAEMRISVSGNGFSRVLSANGAGVVATLFALNQLAAETRLEEHINRYYQLVEFVETLPEAGLIYAAID